MKLLSIYSHQAIFIYTVQNQSFQTSSTSYLKLEILYLSNLYRKVLFKKDTATIT